MKNQDFILQERQIKEAVLRLQILGFHPSIIDSFQDNQLFCSVRMSRLHPNTVPVVYPLTEQEKQLVNRLEKEENSCVFHLVKSKTIDGERYTLLQVGPHENEWEEEQFDLREYLEAVCFVVSSKDKSYSIECVTFQIKDGGLIEKNLAFEEFKNNEERRNDTILPSKKQIEFLREKYPVGTRVELVRMDDLHAPPSGTLGTVKGVDDIGSILVSWDSGSSLNVLYGVDFCKKIETKKVKNRSQKKYDFEK